MTHTVSPQLLWFALPFFKQYLVLDSVLHAINMACALGTYVAGKHQLLLLEICSVSTQCCTEHRNDQVSRGPAVCTTPVRLNCDMEIEPSVRCLQNHT